MFKTRKKLQVKSGVQLKMLADDILTSIIIGDNTAKKLNLRTN